MKRMILTITGAALLVAGSLAAPARADDEMNSRIYRKVSVVEKIFDTMLIDSKFALVSSSANTVGVYLPGYGALFTLEFSFVEKSHGKIFEDLEDLEGLVENWRELFDMNESERAQADSHRRVLFDQVIGELRQALMDYGGTLSFLKDGESISIAAFPWGETWEVTPEPVASLLLTVKSVDLRQYNQGSLTEAELMKRVVVEERID
ncbi:MAG: hypothetical protein HKN20_02925 [Gemmatimonadetes bacterium]|nr:hypothetical protein [Gemmatimonadota bacterium]